MQYIFNSIFMKAVMKQLSYCTYLFALLATATLSGCGGSDSSTSSTNTPSTIALIGDSPYGSPLQTQQSF